MLTLSVWTFGSPGTAERVLRRLEILQANLQVDIDDTAVVCWPADKRRPSTWQAGSLGGPGMLSGAFWGMLFGSLFLLPLTMARKDGDPLPGGAMGHIGLDDSFLQEIRSGVVAGTSALFVLSSTFETVHGVASIGAASGGDLLTKIFSKSEDDRIRLAFADGPDDE